MIKIKYLQKYLSEAIFQEKPKRDINRTWFTWQIPLLCIRLKIIDKILCQNILVYNLFNLIGFDFMWRSFNVDSTPSWLCIDNITSCISVMTLCLDQSLTFLRIEDIVVYLFLCILLHVDVAHLERACKLSREPSTTNENLSGVETAVYLVFSWDIFIKYIFFIIWQKIKDLLTHIYNEHVNKVIISYVINVIELF